MMNSQAEAEPAERDEPLSRAEKRDQQAQRILDAAKTCFVRSGFQGASMQQICAEAGMSPGALYRYFPAKESIIEAIAEADRKVDAEILGRLLDNPDPIDGLVEAAMAHIRHIHHENNAPLFCEIKAESLRNEAVHSACHLIMDEVEAGMGGYLAAAVARGEIDPCVDLRELMPMLMAIGEGLVMNDPVARGVPEQSIETVLRAIITGMLRPTGHKVS